MEVGAHFGWFIWRGINIHPSRGWRMVWEHNQAAHASHYSMHAYMAWSQKFRLTPASEIEVVNEKIREKQKATPDRALPVSLRKQVIGCF